MCNNISGPTELVCYREVSAIKGVCYKRFHCTQFREVSGLWRSIERRT